MSTTLTNGLKLPDKGSVDWYSDMQNNYTILDGAVGTIAEHTTALAGKAPAVHTHTKSDVTDLFSSDNVWTRSNQFTDNILRKSTSYEIGNTPTSDVSLPIRFIDKNNVSIGWVRSHVDTSGATEIELVTSNKFKNNALDPTGTQSYQSVKVGINNTGSAYHQFAGKLKQSELPFTTDTYDLGSSSYQWNNVYSKEYYYNGTAWGLDKTNTWTGNNTFTGRTSYVGIYDKFQTTAFDVRTDPESTRGGDVFRFWSGTGSTYGDYLGGMTFYQSADGSLTLQLICFGYPQTGNSTQNRINFHSARNGTSDFYPVQNNHINLGTSTNKWKTLNGINPGALSLPGAFENINNQIKDPDGNLNAFDLNGGNNTWVSDVDCYLYFYIPNNKFTWIRIFWPPSLVRCGQTFVPVPNETSDYSGFVPVPANTTVVIQVKGTQAPTFRRSACLGNV